MTDPSGTDIPAEQVQAQPSPRTVPWWTLPLVGVLGLVLGGGIGFGASAGSPTASSPTTTKAAPTTARTTAPPPPAAADPEPYLPSPDEFKLAIKVTEKECFGSAGCLIDYHVELTYDGIQPDAGHEYLVTYEVRGVKDGPQINSITVSDGKYSYEDESAQIPSTSTKLTVKVTDVEVR